MTTSAPACWAARRTSRLKRALALYPSKKCSASRNTRRPWSFRKAIESATMLTASGSSRVTAAVGTWTCSPDMFDPIFVPVYLAAHGGLEGLLDLAGDRSRVAVLTHQAVVDRSDRHHLGRRSG